MLGINRGSILYLQNNHLGIVEPVFGHIGDTIGIKRFNLLGKKGQQAMSTDDHAAQPDKNLSVWDGIRLENRAELGNQRSSLTC